MGSCDDDDDNDDDLAAEQRSRVFLEKGQEKKSALNNWLVIMNVPEKSGRVITFRFNKSSRETDPYASLNNIF